MKRPTSSTTLGLTIFAIAGFVLFIVGLCLFLDGLAKNANYEVPWYIWCIMVLGAVILFIQIFIAVSYSSWFGDILYSLTRGATDVAQGLMEPVKPTRSSRMSLPPVAPLQPSESYMEEAQIQPTTYRQNSPRRRMQLQPIGAMDNNTGIKGNVNFGFDGGSINGIINNTINKAFEY